MHAISSQDVNDYLRHATNGDFTAKDFRTWGGTLIAYEAMREANGEQLTLKALLAKVSDALCNTPAVARKSYVHPLLMEAARAGKPIDFPDARATARMSGNERSLVAFLARAG